MKPLLFVALVGAAALATFAGPPTAGLRVTVQAGPLARYHTVVAFAVPPSVAPGTYALVAADGSTHPLQVGPGGKAWFVLDTLAAGHTRTYVFEEQALASPASSGVVLQSDGEQVIAAVDGAEVLRYHAAPTPLPRPDIDPIYQRGGYIHPVYTPAGARVTDDYPPNDHVHHHGIWGAWTKTVFDGRTPDFWNMGAGTGTVRPVALDTVWSGVVAGGFRARHAYVDLSAEEPVTALHEQWDVQIYDVPSAAHPYRIFDLTVTQETATPHALLLPEYRYGGVGFRGHHAWHGPDSTFFLTSEGKDRSNGHATRARWCHIGGYVDGVLAGVGILGHPDNFRAPQPMRIHPSEPFFNWAPSQAGDWAIEPGDTYVARYRYIASDGPPDAALLDRLWNDYAHPPKVTTTPL